MSSQAVPLEAYFVKVDVSFCDKVDVSLMVRANTLWTHLRLLRADAEKQRGEWGMRS